MALIGTSHDITRSRDKLGELLDEITGLRHRIGSMQTLVRAAMNRTRGPLNNILSLAGLLRLEFRPPTEEKEQILDLLTDTAVRALSAIEEYETTSGESQVEAAIVEAEIDFGHLCRDLAAISDPERTLAITFPEATLMADAESLSVLLSAMLAQMCRISDTWVGLAVSPDPRRRHTLQIFLRCDLRTMPTEAEFDEAWMKAMAANHGWSLTVESNPQSADDVPSITLALKLPGRILRGVAQYDTERMMGDLQPVSDAS